MGDPDISFTFCRSGKANGTIRVTFYGLLHSRGRKHLPVIPAPSFSHFLVCFFFLSKVEMGRFHCRDKGMQSPAPLRPAASMAYCIFCLKKKKVNKACPISSPNCFSFSFKPLVFVMPLSAGLKRPLQSQRWVRKGSKPIRSVNRQIKPGLV